MLCIRLYKEVFIVGLIVLGTFGSILVQAQSKVKPELDLDKFILDLFGAQTGSANYDDIYESLFQYYRYPLDLNKATREDLQELYVLSPGQIASLLQYRQKNGDFLTIFELQAVPGLDETTIQHLLPFVKVTETNLSKDARGLWQRIKEEENNYLISRLVFSPETERGFRVSDEETQRFKGLPMQLYTRYRVSQKNDFSINLTTENDVGEQLRWNPSRKQYGMDFYSGHISLYDKGRFKNITVGDYQVLIGQGVSMSAGFYLGKGAETVASVKRSNQGIRPYSSALESGFMRGVASTLKFGRFDVTNFYSYRNLDGNVVVQSDSLGNNRSAIASSIIRTGFHRTESELENKGTVQEQIGGTYAVYHSANKNFKMGVNGLYFQYNPSIVRTTNAYNVNEFSGNSNYNTGADFVYTWKNFNFFGEYALSASGGNGVIAGFASSLSPKLDFALLGRSFDPNFHAFYGNSFGELAANRNERGVYFGLKFIQSKKFNFTTFYDYFWLPWLTSTADAPSMGYEYLIRANWFPTHKITLYGQYRNDHRQLNAPDNATPTDYLTDTRRGNYLINMDYKAEKWITLKSRVQWTDFQYYKGKYSSGIALIQDVTFDYDKKFKVSTRFAIFDTDDFNTRLYVYEKNALYAFSLPIYYGQGIRYYVLFQYKVNKNTDIWLRIARFDYRNQSSIGSGLNQLEGNNKTDVTLQVKYDF